MVPPALAAHLNLIAGGRFATLSKRSQFLAIGDKTAGVGESGAKGERDGHKVVPLADGTGLGQCGCMVVGHAPQLGLGITNIFLFTMTGLDGADRAFPGQPIADHCSTFFFTPTRHSGQGTHDHGALPFSESEALVAGAKFGVLRRGQTVHGRCGALEAVPMPHRLLAQGPGRVRP